MSKHLITPSDELQAFLDAKIPNIPNRVRKHTQVSAPTATTTDILKDYISFPTLGLAFSPEIILQDKNWYHTHKALLEKDLIMPTIRQTWDAIHYAIQNLDDPRMQHFYDSILKTTESGWHSEWQNDYFEKDDNGKMYVKHLTGFDNNGEPVFSSSKEISDYLQKDNFASIHNLTEDGLCKQLSGDEYKQGENIKFWYPENDGRVARFGAYSNLANLYCNRDPTDDNGGLGVRAVKPLNSKHAQQNGGRT